jgi:hypothetical protein
MPGGPAFLYLIRLGYTLSVASSEYTGNVMSRVVLLLLVGLSVFGCANSQAMKELAAKRLAAIEAAKIPPVDLSEQQIAKLKEFTPRAEIAWLRAGRQSDGKIFVCHVVEGKNFFGTRGINLMTGTFEADGSYQQSRAYLWSLRAVLEECHAHGFAPPVTIRTNYSVMRI